MKILNLTLHKKWFGMIRNGIKLEEYREIKPYWNVRLDLKSYDAVRFTNGYGKNRPVIMLELLNVYQGVGKIEWGAPEKKRVHILKLGRILEELENEKPNTM